MTEAKISNSFTSADQERFRALLELANGSQFEGERDNALAAAKRLADRHGLTLEEAAAWRPEPVRQERRPTEPQPEEMADPFAYRPGRTADQWWQTSLDQQTQDAEKKRWEDAVKSARNRGLDGGENKEADNFGGRRSNSKSRRNPVTHATILLKETSLPIKEIADITGLKVHDIVALKLKLRKAA